MCVVNYFASATMNLCCNDKVLPCGAASTAVNELCNNRCIVLNYYDLGLLQVGLKSFVISVDYRDYMGSSLHLNSYNLVGSMTAGIRASSAL